MLRPVNEIIQVYEKDIKYLLNNIRNVKREMKRELEFDTPRHFSEFNYYTLMAIFMSDFNDIYELIKPQNAFLKKEVISHLFDSITCKA